MAAEDLKKALDSSKEVELTVTGRKSGRELPRPVWFAQEGDKLYLVPVSGSKSEWYRNVVETPRIQLAAAGARLEANATPITDPAKVDQVLDKFRAKYGAQAVEQYGPKQDVAVEVLAT